MSHVRRTHLLRVFAHVNDDPSSAFAAQQRDACEPGAAKDAVMLCKSVLLKRRCNSAGCRR